MTQQTQLSSKVSDVTLDTMYGNFVKITDWLIKGKQSQYPMPASFSALFDAAELVQTQQQLISEQSKIIGGLQQRLAQLDGRISALENTVKVVNGTLELLADIANTKLQEAFPNAVSAETNVSTIVQPPVEPTLQAETELVDLGAVITEIAQQQAPVQQAPVQQAVSPNEQAIQVSAAAVGAGNIDPASYAALDKEISALLG